MSGEPKHTSTGVVVDHVGVRKLTALLVRLESGFQVKIRSGLTEGQRRNPPPVGTTVVVGWNTVMKNTGRPRAVTFLHPHLRRVA